MKDFLIILLIFLGFICLVVGASLFVYGLGPLFTSFNFLYSLGGAILFYIGMIILDALDVIKFD